MPGQDNTPPCSMRRARDCTEGVCETRANKSLAAAIAESCAKQEQNRRRGELRQGGTDTSSCQFSRRGSSGNTGRAPRLVGRRNLCRSPNPQSPRAGSGPSFTVHRTFHAIEGGLASFPLNGPRSEEHTSEL